MSTSSVSPPRVSLNAPALAARRLYNRAELSPGTRVSLTTDTGTKLFLRKHSHSLDIALQHPSRWPTQAEWNEIVSTLPVPQSLDVLQKRGKAGFVLYSLNASITTNYGKDTNPLPLESH